MSDTPRHRDAKNRLQKRSHAGSNSGILNSKLNIWTFGQEYMKLLRLGLILYSNSGLVGYYCQPKGSFQK